MNGMQIMGYKRLKVQLKKGDDDEPGNLTGASKYQPY